jgi:hypothetical protein
VSGAIYDAAELRRRIVVCFSSHELRELAEQLGVASVAPWDRGASEAARELVRHYQRSGSLPVLVDALRGARPLVEWPEPAAAAATEISGVAPTLLDTPSPAGEGLWVTPDEDTPLSEPPAHAAVPASSGVGGGAAAPASARGPQRGPAAGWPTTVSTSEREPARGLDARILIAVAGLMVVAAVVAFAAGRATTAAAPAEAPLGTAASSAPGAASARASRPDGPATRVSAAVMRSVANVGRACEVRGAEPSTVLRGALSRCGPAAAPSRARTAPTEGDAAPGDRPAGEAADGDTTGIPARPVDNGPAAVGAPTSPCVAGCDAQHRGCKQKCGPEPKHSTEYAEHQQCLARCLAAASKCRVGCR